MCLDSGLPSRWAAPFVALRFRSELTDLLDVDLHLATLIHLLLIGSSDGSPCLEEVAQRCSPNGQVAPGADQDRDSDRREDHAGWEESRRVHQKVGTEGICHLGSRQEVEMACLEADSGEPGR